MFLSQVLWMLFGPQLQMDICYLSIAFYYSSSFLISSYFYISFRLHHSFLFLGPIVRLNDLKHNFAIDLMASGLMLYDYKE